MSAIIKSHFTTEQIALIKSTVMAGKIQPTDNDLALFGLICQRLNLNPFPPLSQVYAIERKGKWVFQISIDGLRAIADRTGQYAGSDEPLFDEGITEWEAELAGRKQPTVCKVTVYKMVSGQRCPFVGIAKFSESAQSFYDATTKSQKMAETWAKMPFSMLSKCAESQALRKAFPQCLATEQTLQSATVEDDSWRISGYEWAVSRGVDPEVANQIVQVATSKENLYQRLQSAIPVEAKAVPVS